MWTGDVRNMTAFQKSVLFNTQALAINQDVCAGSRQGDLLAQSSDGTQQLWGRRMCDGTMAALLYNRANSSATLSLTTAQLGWPSGTEATVRDVWANTTATTAHGAWSTLVDRHGVALVRLTRSSAQ